MSTVIEWITSAGPFSGRPITVPEWLVWLALVVPGLFGWAFYRFGQEDGYIKGVKAASAASAAIGVLSAEDDGDDQWDRYEDEDEDSYW